MNTYACPTFVAILVTAGILQAADPPWSDHIKSDVTAAITATKRYIELANAGTGMEQFHERLRQSSVFAEAIDRLGKSVEEFLGSNLNIKH